MYNLECPYCHKEIRLDFTDDGYYIENEELFQKECPECEMLLNVYPTIRVDFELEKCVCQGENHVWQPTITSPHCMTEMECIYCGKRRKPTDEEKAKYDIPSVESFIEEMELERKNLKQGK